MRALQGFLAWVLLAIAGGPACANTLVSAGKFVYTEPPSTEEPTAVLIRAYLHDIRRIDNVNQEFSFDLFVTVSWQDPRLALPESERSGRARSVRLDDIWTPRVLIVNERSVSPRLPRVAQVNDAGQVLYRQRLAGELAANLVLNDFPFDTQVLPITLLSYQYSPEQVVFDPASSLNGEVGLFSLEGWNLNIGDAQIDTFVPNKFVQLEGKGERPRMQFFIQAERRQLYFVLTMFVPIALIVFMAWGVFWLSPQLVPPRIAISTAAIFSLIAFGFSIRLNLPPVSYLTRADVFVAGSTLLVFAAFGTTVAGTRLAGAERVDAAERLNVLARAIYPAVFAILAALALLY